ncbi:hypothetical protein [Streptomyces sp. DSM 118878]
MTDNGVERNDEQPHAPDPWWAGIGTWGAVGLIVFGASAAAWVFLGLPGTSEGSPTAYLGAAKVAAIGLVIAGTALLGRRRTQATDTDTDT